MHEHITVSVARCIFLYDSGRCGILRKIAGVHDVIAAIQANYSIDCAVVKELDGLFNYTNGTRHAIVSTVALDNRAVMSFAESSKLFVADIDSHWPDHVLSHRSRRELPSLMLNCNKFPKENLTGIPYFKKAYCPHAAFRRGECVNKKASWMVKETWQPGNCPLLREGPGDGYHNVI